MESSLMAAFYRRAVILGRMRIAKAFKLLVGILLILILLDFGEQLVTVGFADASLRSKMMAPIAIVLLTSYAWGWFRGRNAADSPPG